MYPIKLEPVLKDIVWGGDRLKNDFGYESDLERVAEAWVLTARPDGDNRIRGGAFDGHLFTEFLAEHPEALGEKGKNYADFPLLIKLIDAKTDLSVQVHPNDEYAKKHENSFGKTEAWYVLDCTEGASLIYGFNKKIDRATFQSSIADQSFLEYVNRVPVHKGDVFFIESGTLHAIGGGILLAEVQQNCNTTYRVYDYGRLVGGKPRELHIEKALDVTVTEPPKRGCSPEGEKVRQGGAVLQKLCSCSFFNMTSITLDGEYILNIGPDTFYSLLVLEGRGSVTAGGSAISVKKGDSVFLAAGSGDVRLGGSFRALTSTL